MSFRLQQIPWNLVLLMIVAAGLRFTFLDIKPAHFDEGVNGWFADELLANGYFRYDPTNYHGPLHFYAVFLSQNLFGRNLWALRLPTVLVSLAAVFLCWKFGKRLGRTTGNVAAWAMAVSPAFLFYGRYAIHEAWLVFFLMLFAYGALGLWRTRSSRDATLVIVAVTGMILTKETYIIHLTCFALAGLLTWGFAALHRERVPSPPALFYTCIRTVEQWPRWAIVTPLVLAAIVIVFFYSGNFLDWGSLNGLWQTYAAWFKTGVHEAGGHAKTAYDLWGQWFLNYYWILLFARFEWPAFAGLLGSIRYLLPGRGDIRWIAIYATGTLAGYSLVAYKTPWCIVSLLWPFLIVFGAVIEEAAKRSKPAALGVAVVVIACSGVYSAKLSYFDYADHSHPYVYVQTDPGIRIATEPLLGMASRNPEFYHVEGQILLKSYYPLPWTLGDFTNVGYYGNEMLPPELDGDFILVEGNRREEVEVLLKEPYFVREFKLRDGMDNALAYFKVSRYAEWFPNVKPEFIPGEKTP